MSNDISKREDFSEGHHRHGREHHGHGKHGRGGHGLHSGRKLSSSDLQLLLLLLMDKQPSHGYELIKSLEERSDGFYVPSPGMIYPALTYLEEAGLTSLQADGAKKLYGLTSEGHAHLQQNREVVEGIMTELERIGAQMANARKAFAAEANDGETSEELEAARRGLRRAQRDREPYTPDEAKRIAGILERSSREISGEISGRPSALNESPIFNPTIHRVLTRMLTARHRPPRGRANPGERPKLDPYEAKNVGFSIAPEQGELIYLLCRAMGVRRVVEFATSLGFSTIYLAAAVRDNGGGLVIGSELVPEKVETARRNLWEAGLAEWVEIREGDALETLRDAGDPIDFLLVDGWHIEEGPSLARRVLELVAPQMRVGAIVLNDNGEPDYLEYVRDPANGFRSMSLPLKGSSELSVKVN